VDSGVGSGEFLQTGQEPFSFSQASRCAVAAVVMVVAVEGTGGVVGAATEVGGEEDGGDRERRVKRLGGYVLQEAGLERGPMTHDPKKNFTLFLSKSIPTFLLFTSN
jgi:hypothetical protein